jgi:hypothetical protein
VLKIVNMKLNVNAMVRNNKRKSLELLHYTDSNSILEFSTRAGLVSTFNQIMIEMERIMTKNRSDKKLIMFWVLYCYFLFFCKNKSEGNMMLIWPVLSANNFQQ